MPIYEYEPLGESCDYCEGTFSDLQSLRDVPLTQCPECGNACRRIFSTFLIGNGSVAKGPAPKTSKLATTSDQASSSKPNPSAGSHANHNCSQLGCHKRAAKLLKDYK